MTKNNIDYQEIKKSYIGGTKAQRLHKVYELIGLDTLFRTKTASKP